jgi:hypothetical protein
MYSESYSFFSERSETAHPGESVADPTETIVEWLVEMKMGQQEIFTYNQMHTDSKSLIKLINFYLGIEGQILNLKILRKGTRFCFYNANSTLPSNSSAILKPPPDHSE